MRLIRAEDVAAAGAEELIAALREALATGGRASLALSGGETPWRMVARLAPDDLDWTRVAIYQVDERIVPLSHPDRNLRRLLESLHIPAAIHPMPVDATDLVQASADYAASLPKVLDIVQLGLGADGHTASLIPGDPVLDATADVAIAGPYQAHRRMTLTFASINRARRIVWLVAGAAKREALAELINGNAGAPANRVARQNATVVADAAAVAHPPNKAIGSTDSEH